MMTALPNLRGFAKAWDRFFFRQVDVRICGAFRIGFAVLLLANSLGYYAYLDQWFGESGVLPFDASRLVVDPDTLTIFAWLPETATTLWICYGIFNAQILALLIGFHSRIQAICLFAWLVSFQHRNQLILDGEDTLFRVFCFLLILLPLSDSLSLDAFLKARRAGRRGAVALKPAWALRLIQIQTTLVVLCAGWEKALGTEWIDGTAMYYVASVEDLFGRFPVPGFFFEFMPATNLLTWSVLAVELSLPVLIWFRRTRRSALAVALVFHLSIDYTMNLFLFQWIMLLGWLTFIEPADLIALRQSFGKLAASVQSALSAGAQPDPLAARAQVPPEPTNLAAK